MTLMQAIDVYKTYASDGKRVEVLRGLNLTIEKGEVVNILGASGVGKSTLLHILGALDRPSGGRIIHDGVDIFSLNDRDLAAFRNRKIGFVFQFHHLLPEFTALENVMMPGLVAGWPKAKAVSEAEEVLGSLGLEHRLLHKPGELSGGEQQRVAVARAIVLEPDLVLADEPTGNLDTKTSEEVHRMLMELNAQRQITMIIVTHNLTMANLRGRNLKLVNGALTNA